ncbi:hypothetical protein KAR91_34425 [Candidatus Pacearchaeota archaeon]|nr:hypothetical protein [Candidatus Pacearchaeota archaeon]
MPLNFVNRYQRKNTMDLRGKFSFTIGPEDLSKGLRHTKRMPRDSGRLVTCNGAVGRDGVLQAIDELTRIATTAITDGFPYPQIFVFTNYIIVCGETTIYEWVSSALVSKLTVTAGDPWSAVDFYNFAYMSNSKVAVIRNSTDQTYEITTNLPLASTICNYNGQVLIGAPDVETS